MFLTTLFTTLYEFIHTPGACFPDHWFGMQMLLFRTLFSVLSIFAADILPKRVNLLSEYATHPAAQRPRPSGSPTTGTGAAPAGKPTREAPPPPRSTNSAASSAAHSAVSRAPRSSSASSPSEEHPGLGRSADIFYIESRI